MCVRFGCLRLETKMCARVSFFIFVRRFASVRSFHRNCIGILHRLFSHRLRFGNKTCRNWIANRIFRFGGFGIYTCSILVWWLCYVCCMHTFQFHPFAPYDTLWKWISRALSTFNVFKLDENVTGIGAKLISRAAYAYCLTIIFVQENKMDFPNNCKTRWTRERWLKGRPKERLIQRRGSDRERQSNKEMNEKKWVN